MPRYENIVSVRTPVTTPLSVLTVGTELSSSPPQAVNTKPRTIGSASLAVRSAFMGCLRVRAFNSGPGLEHCHVAARYPGQGTVDGEGNQSMVLVRRNHCASSDKKSSCTPSFTLDLPSGYRNPALATTR